MMNAAGKSDQVVRVLIHGASGRMGQSLLRLSQERPGTRIVAAVSRQPATQADVPWFGTADLAMVPEFDVAIDFSLPDGFDHVLALCRQRGVALVSGTTGLAPAQRAALEDAARAIPVLWASNFSLGVAVLTSLVERAARALPDWDCDIVEAHHKGKLDAPSGTALSLGAAAEREGAQPRYASLRAGDIVGEHVVQFTTAGERIELAHRAGNRDIFARGALHAAVKLAGAAPGNYRLADVIG